MSTPRIGSTKSDYIKNKRVVVTGGAGFIGSELVRQLAANGARVTVIDNLVNGRRENLKGLPSDRVCLVVEDIRNARSLTKFLSKTDVVFHLACLGVRHSIHAPEENHRVNAEGTLKILIASRTAKVKRFVYISSSEVYGTARYVPMDEDHPAYPLTVYGSSKLAGECYSRAFFETYGFQTVVVRPFNTYGPNCHHEGDSGEVIPKFMLRCLVGRPMFVFGDGTQTRDFTYVSDTARGIMAAGFSSKVLGKTINLGQGRETSIITLARKVKDVLGKVEVKIVHQKPRPGDVLRLHADTSLAKKFLGFKPLVSLEQGLEKLRDWYVSSGRSPVELLQQERVKNWK